MLILTREHVEGLEDAERVIEGKYNQFLRMKDGMELIKIYGVTPETEKENFSQKLINQVNEVAQVVDCLKNYRILGSRTYKPELSSINASCILGDKQLCEYLINDEKETISEMEFEMGKLIGMLELCDSSIVTRIQNDYRLLKTKSQVITDVYEELKSKLEE